MNKQNYLLPVAIVLLAGGFFLLLNAKQEAIHMNDKAMSVQVAVQPAPAPEETLLPESAVVPSPEPTEEPSSEGIDPAPAEETIFLLPGESRNAASLSQREVFAENFYAEPLSEELLQYMYGKTIPLDADSNPSTPGMDTSDLRYLHILYVNFEAETLPGEIICNKAIAADLLEIFHELYLNAYPLERVELIEEYGGDDNASMAANNTSAFNYRVVENTTNLSNHAYGVAIDINPYYNPYIAYTTGEKRITPPGSELYEDRSQDFEHKIDESDLCYKLFKEHGFTWGGNWKTMKDYQHFQKPLK